MNILTRETQTAYKQSRSTQDVLNHIKEITGYKYPEMSITLMDLTKAFDKTNRQLMYTKHIEKGLPLEIIRMIMKTHQKTQLESKRKKQIIPTDRDK